MHNDDQAIDVLRPSGRRTLLRGEMLFAGGDEVECVYRVVRGRVRLERCLLDGRVVGVQTVRAGELVAEGALFADRYHCDAVAETRTEVELERRSAFLERLSAEPRSLLRLCEWLSRRLRATRLQLEVRNVRPARERLLRYLETRHALGHPPADRPVRRIADELGIAPETLYRLLADLEAEGEIIRRGRSVRLAGADREPVG